MLVLFGYIIIIGSVLGGYVLSGGNIASLIQPFEFMIIAGAALGAFIVGNNIKVIKQSFKEAFSTLKKNSYSKKFYIELLSLFFDLTNKIKKEGVLAIEGDIENYKESPIFSKYPSVLKEKMLMEFICDHLRLIVTGRVEPNQLEELMDQDIETLESELELPIAAITKTADSMPAFGIVAAVMGVVITMQSINGSAQVLGEHVAKALVGTFLGVLMGYGFIAPIASVLENRLRGRIQVLQSVKIVLIASVHNLAPVIAVEFARKVLYSQERPTSREMEEVMRSIRSGGAAETQAEEKTEEPVA